MEAVWKVIFLSHWRLRILRQDSETDRDATDAREKKKDDIHLGERKIIVIFFPLTANCNR
jgi:hypothetical protein